MNSLVLAVVALFAFSSSFSPCDALNITSRTFSMGFSSFPPRLSIPDVITTVDMFSQRAEFAAIHESPSWKKLLSGVPAAQILQDDKAGLVAYMRSKNLSLFWLIEPTNGLARESEAEELAAANRSIAEPEIRALFVEWALTVESMFHPELFGFASETNLIRLAGGPYAGALAAATAAAQALRANGTKAKLMFSIQADTAWGKLGPASPFLGIQQDVDDFGGWADFIGISSYPYFAFKDPNDIPSDYYSRIVLNATRAKRFEFGQVEGGWPSIPTTVLNTTSAEMQARYIDIVASLLQGIEATTWIQLSFTDLDMVNISGYYPSPILPYFASLGLVNISYGTKPALLHWDAVFNLPIVAPEDSPSPAPQPQSRHSSETISPATAWAIGFFVILLGVVISM